MSGTGGSASRRERSRIRELRSLARRPHRGLGSACVVLTAVTVLALAVFGWVGYARHGPAGVWGGQPWRLAFVGWGRWWPCCWPRFRPDPKQAVAGSSWAWSSAWGCRWSSG